jgi:pimeloyl-ACP methyl ester carboxylesterase
MPTATLPSRLLDAPGLRALKRAGFQPRGLRTPEGDMVLLERRSNPEGPTLALLHGVSSRGSHLQALALRVAPACGRILLPDFLGHGHSTSPAGLDTPRAVRGMTAALDQLLDHPAYLYGNSMGGWAALKYAAARPDRVAGVFVTAPAGGQLDEKLREHVVSAFVVRSYADAGVVVDRAFGRPPLPRWLMALALRSRMDRPVVHQLLDSAGPEVDLTPGDLASLTMPVTVMWGGADRLLHPQQRDWFRQHLPQHARFEERPAWGHSPYVDQLPELVPELTAFLSRTQGR